MSSKKLTGTQLKNFRRDVAKLKAKGLVSKRIDARAQKPTRYMQGQVKKYGDVLEGKAAVIKLPKRSAAKEFSEKFRTKGRSVVVPIRKGEKLGYSKATGEISASSKIGGKRVRRRMSSKGATRDSAPISGNVLYTIPIGNSRQSFDTWDDLVLFMEPYEINTRNPYKDWMKYVEITDYDGGDEE